MDSPRYPTDQEIWDLARSNGLDPFAITFENVPASVLYEIAAYLIPGRMAHWSYGKAYHAMKMRYDYGLNKLYEMVINANPAYAFLLASNSELENTFVRAHVMGHVDFFHHNHCFHHTGSDMVEVVSRHAERVRQYEFQVGHTAVEQFLDAVLSLQEHISLPAPSVRPRAVENHLRPQRGWSSADWGLQSPSDSIGERQVKPNTHEEEDLLRFIMVESHYLEDWERDVIEMVRQEMMYFWPQIRTKVMNEGWATYWHATLMRQLTFSDDDYIDYARLHSQVTAPLVYQVNPYALGYSVFQDLERRQGRDAIFLARTVDDDVSFVRNYLTEEVAEALHLFVYGADQDHVIVKSRQFELIRDQLVKELVHGGIPVIHVNDGDFNQRGELYLIHRHEGVDLDLPYAERTLRYVHRLWGRPVHLETRSSNKRLILSFDGHLDTKTVL